MKFSLKIFCQYHLLVKNNYNRKDIMKLLLAFCFMVLMAGEATINNIQAQITATQMGMLDFTVDQALTGNDMNGTNDVTVKLQSAVDNARLANKTLFIPSGTYKISNRIDCKLDFGGSNGWKMLTPVCIVGSSVNRPVIKLADNLAIFNDTCPKAVFSYRGTTHSTPDCTMEGGVRSLNFDLGTGNANAVGLYWGCAQYCFIEDISIYATGTFFAGFTGIGGANQLLGNISVTGGRYGLYLPNVSEGAAWEMPEICQSTISGCTFTNQTNAALHLWGWGGITMVGITIVKDSGTALEMKGDSYAPVICFPFSLIDSKIMFTSSRSSNVAIQNLTRANVALNGVYIMGAGVICNNNGDENLVALTPITSWTHVKRFNYVDKVARHDEKGNLYAGTHYNALGGTFFTAAIIQTDATTPPSDLTSKHIWASTPSFEDADAHLVPAGSSAETIQAAINTWQKVCLAKGTYTLSTPITLKANSVFFGCPGLGLCGSVLTNGYTAKTAIWLINTEDNAVATTYLMDMCTDPSDADYQGSLHWMAGANSIIRTAHFRSSGNAERNLIKLYFSGNGGGRVFNYQDEKAANNNLDPNHRKVKISGTSQQLTFYGLNLERGGSITPTSAWPMLEIANASKIRIFGAKTEAKQPYATINDCTDIFITNLIDYSGSRTIVPSNYVEISGTNDKIELSNIIWTVPPGSAWKLVLDPWNTNEPSRQMNLGVYHYNWSSISDTATAM